MKENRWFWGVGGFRGATIVDRAEDQFIVALGHDEFWGRVAVEFKTRDCHWGYINDGPSADVPPTLADCMRVFLPAREMYGVHYNRLIFELCRVPAFASFIKDSGSDLCNWISNPISPTPLPRQPYHDKLMQQVGEQIGRTLKLPEDWWV